MELVKSHISIIILTINEFNSSIERHRVARWIKKYMQPTNNSL